MHLKAHLSALAAFLSVVSAAPIDAQVEERDLVDRQFPPGLPGFPSIPSLPFPTGLPGGRGPAGGGQGGGIPSIPGFPLPPSRPGGGGGFPGLPSGGGGGGGGGFPGFPQPTSLPGGSGSGGSPGFPSFPGGGGGSGGGFGGSSTENGVTSGGACTPLTVIFARGTGEAGNVGSAAGPPMFAALRQALGQDKVTVQGVDYPASAAGNAQLGSSGGPTMSQVAQQALKACPSTKLALSGYSQGAMVVHSAASQPGFPGQSVSSVVLFGDPLNGQAVQGVDKSKVLEICAQGDALCEGGRFGGITPAHLTYGDHAQEAAAFVEKMVG
ncbi:MAG: hypothetical protein Q9160_003210 [Pyrenula sp. 1 TL-2023]